MSARLFFFFAAGLLAACATQVEERQSAADTAATLQIGNSLTVQVEGGVIAAHTEPDSLHRGSVRIRATGPDVRLVVQDSGCAASTLDVEVVQIATDTDFSWRAFRGALTPQEIAERTCCGSAVARESEDADPDWHPLGPEQKFTPLAPDDEGALHRCWTLRTEPGRDRVEVSAPPGGCPLGVTTPDPPVEPALACADFRATAAGGGLGAAPLIVRQHLTWHPPRGDDGSLRFAVFGNHAGSHRWRQAIVEDVTRAAAEDGVRFAVVNGDLTGDGSVSQLAEAAADLDALPIPWYATVGDRDIDGDAEGELVRTLGPLTFSFDVESDDANLALRVIVLDSADGGLSKRAFGLLDDWLVDAAPRPRVVITHFAPFDPFGLRGGGFKSRPEAARLVAALTRGQVDALITSNLARYDEQHLGQLTVYHSGGGGAPLESLSGAKHHWLEVVVDAESRLRVERHDL